MLLYESKINVICQVCKSQMNSLACQQIVRYVDNMVPIHHLAPYYDQDIVALRIYSHLIMHEINGAYASFASRQIQGTATKCRTSSSSNNRILGGQIEGNFAHILVFAEDCLSKQTFLLKNKTRGNNIGQQPNTCKINQLTKLWSTLNKLRNLCKRNN